MPQVPLVPGSSPGLSCPDMLSARRRVAAPLACVVVLSTVAPGSARAADPPKTNESSAAAHQHAARAHDLYQQGAYHEAISELEAALKLDPNGKDLVYNLGVVHEKLGDIDDAIRYFERYERMDLDPQERAKAETYMKRLQGARKEVEKPPEPPPPQPPPPQPPPPQPLPAPVEKRYGRFDWLTASTAVVTLGGLAVGTVFGVKALLDRPKAGAATTDTYGYAQYAASQQTAHNEAIVADVGLLVGAVGFATTAVLFFARARDSSHRAAGTAGPALRRVVLSGTPLRGGGAVVLEARF